MNNFPLAVPTVRSSLATALAVALALLLTLGSATSAEAKPNGYANALFELAHPTGLQKFAKSVSSPNSKRYQQYRSVAWIVKRYGAKPKTKKRALRYLEARGIEAEVDGAGQNLIVTMDAEEAESFIGSGASVSSTKDGGSGVVPAGLRGAVTGITFLDSEEKFDRLAPFPPQPSGSPYPAGSSLRPHSGTQTGCAAGRRGIAVVPEANRNFTPNQFLDAYGISDLHKQGFKGQGRRIAVVEIDGFKRSDIVEYGKCYGKRVPPTKIHLAGIKKALAPGIETTLDLQVLTAVAPQLEAIDVYEGGSTEVGIMLSTSHALGKPGKTPAAISISLGTCEAQLGGQMQFRRGLDNIFAVAAGAGISVTVAAGDTGVSGCAFDGNKAALYLQSVGDPASSTWVTAVGGTNFVLNDKNQILQEFPWNDGPPYGPGAGGGGLSILATQRPWYQNGPGFNKLGLSRGVPDVALLGDGAPGYSVYCTAPGLLNGCFDPPNVPGGWLPVGGTSAATPLTAGMLTLVSQKLAKAGKKPIGFANPLMYKLGNNKKARSGVFRDITVGNNDTGKAIPVAQGGGKPLGCCYASKGYDLASGWGSLKAIGLAKAAAKHAKRKGR